MSKKKKGMINNDTDKQPTPLFSYHIKYVRNNSYLNFTYIINVA